MINKGKNKIAYTHTHCIRDVCILYTPPERPEYILQMLDHGGRRKSAVLKPIEEYLHDRATRYVYDSSLKCLRSALGHHKRRRDSPHLGDTRHLQLCDTRHNGVDKETDA